MKIQYNPDGLLQGNYNKLDLTVMRLSDNFNWGEDYVNDYPQCLIDTAMLSMVNKLIPIEYQKIEDYTLNFLKNRYKKLLHLRKYDLILENNTFLKLYDNIATGFEYFAVEPDMVFRLYDTLEELENNSDIGYIYIIENNGYHKIGKTKHFDKRINTYFRTENPNPYKLVYYKEIYFHSIIEKQLHQVFKKNNYNREWFTLEKNDFKTIRKLLNIFSLCK